MPELGDIVEMQFFVEHASEYLGSAHGKSPHRNEDLLCQSLTLRGRCALERNDTWQDLFGFYERK